MNNFLSGLVAGGVLGVVGAGWAMSDDRAKRRIVKSGKKTLKKANEVVSDVRDML